MKGLRRRIKQLESKLETETLKKWWSSSCRPWRARMSMRGATASATSGWWFASPHLRRCHR